MPSLNASLLLRQGARHLNCGKLAKHFNTKPPLERGEVARVMTSGIVTA